MYAHEIDLTFIFRYALIKGGGQLMGDPLIHNV